MAIFVALLRAVNVGGTGILPMNDLKALCTRAGLHDPHTYLASGNVVFQSAGTAAEAKVALERELHGYAEKAVRVLVRGAAELEQILRANPFTDTNPAHTMVVFLDAPPDPQCLAAASGWAGEEARLGARELYIHYGAGMGALKASHPGGPGRNRPQPQYRDEAGRPLAARQPSEGRDLEE